MFNEVNTEISEVPYKVKKIQRMHVVSANDKNIPRNIRYDFTETQTTSRRVFGY